MSNGGPSLMDTLFQHTLEDLIKSLRQTTTAAAATAVISKSIADIRREIKSTDLATKSAALQKLTYLHSLHSLDASWAAFHAVELVSSPVFSHKKSGYSAVSLSFCPETDVVLLLTNQLRKDLKSGNPHEVSLALECLSVVCNSDLARDLTHDVFTLLGTSKGFVKKKAVATLLGVFDMYPDAVRVCFKRLVENLDCGDVQVLGATVSVFCELASKEPRAYLPLAPEFYKVLVDSRNNWILIKVLKIFAKLAPLEPRLAKKVVDPICEHMRRSGAKSLVFECVRTVVGSLSDHETAVKLAVEKIREFLVDDDPNLKYLGLQGLSFVVKNHPWAVLESREVVIKSLSDDDRNIKIESLRLVMTMVSEDNVAEICRVLISYALKSDPEFSNDIIESILSTCSRNVYEIVTDFDWYVSLLGEMSRIPHCQRGDEIEFQLVDIGMRVKDVRPQLVRVGRDLLIDPALLGNPNMHRVLSAAAWISGEYVHFSCNPFEVIEALLQPHTSLLPPVIRAVYIHSVLKVMTFCLYSYFFPNEAAVSLSDEECLDRSYLDDDQHVVDPRENEVFDQRGLRETVEGIATTSLDGSKKDTFSKESTDQMLTLVETALKPLLGCHEVEIEERVRNVLGVIEFVHLDFTKSLDQKENNIDGGEVITFEMVRLMYDAFLEELGPVPVSAQGRVPVPDGLVLEENLSSLERFCEDIQIPIRESFSLGGAHNGRREGISPYGQPHEEESQQSTESTSLLAEHRKRHGLFYLPSEKSRVTSTEYPPANESSLLNSVNDGTEDLVKLTNEVLVLGKKSNQAKPRPVVVKLDERDEIHVKTNKVDSNDELISGAVREVLLGDDPNHIEKSSSKKKRMKGQLRNEVSEAKEDSENVMKSECDASSSKSKHRHHPKERKHQAQGKIVDGRERNGETEKHKTGNRHGRRKAQTRADGPIRDVEQTPVIPDYLL